MSTGGRLDGAIGLVTGGDRGIGRGIVLALAREGSRVAINHVEAADRAEALVDEIVAAGGEAFAIQGDVRREADVERMVETVVQRFGGLTLYVNNAGVQTWKPLLDITEAEWDLVLDTNLKGCFLGTRAAARHMKDQGVGSIVNIGSGSNKTAFPRLSSYTASKGGIEMFTKVAAVELGPYGIRVNCIAPGAVEVERTRLERKDYAGTWAAVTPLGRVGYPDDIGRAVVLVASGDAAFITGQTIWVDGGLFNQPPWPGDDV